MTENELSLLEIIRGNDNPDEAIVTAVNTIISFLEQCESYPRPSVVCPLGQA